jgi:hypothetical protein
MMTSNAVIVADKPSVSNRFHAEAIDRRKDGWPSLPVWLQTSFAADRDWVSGRE